MKWQKFDTIAATIADHGWDRITSQETLNELLVYLYEARYGPDEIAKIFGTSRSTIGQHLKALGVLRSIAEGQRKGWKHFRRVRTRLRNQQIYVNTPNELDLWCRQQYEYGLSAKQIGRICGVTETSIKVHLRKVETQFRPAGQPSPAGTLPWNIKNVPPETPSVGSQIALTPSITVTMLGWRYDSETDAWLLKLGRESKIMLCTHRLFLALHPEGDLR